VILCDDLGYGDVSALNPNSKIQTPNVDRIANEGISFTDAHTTSAVCSPSRYGVLTGRYNFRSSLKHGIVPSYGESIIEPGRPTIASLLRARGYHTMAVGKWHVGIDWKSKDGRYVSEGGRIDPKKVDPGIDFTAPFRGGPVDCGFDTYFGLAASLDIPPFVYLEGDRATCTPNGQDYTQFAANINGLTIFPGDEGLGSRPGPVQAGMHADRVLHDLTDRAVADVAAAAAGEKPFFLYLAMTAPHTPVVPSPEFVGKSGTNDQYLDFVLEVDHCVGRVLGALAAAGVADETMVLFTSDNGPENFMHLRKEKIGHYSAAHLRGCKRDNWDGGHRVPFVCRWPGRIPAGQTSGQVACLTDILATTVAAAGGAAGDHAGEDSVSLLEIMLGEAAETIGRDAVIHHSSNGSFAIRQGPWKLLVHAGSGAGKEVGDDEAAVQLYCMGEDETETGNLYRERPDVVRALGATLIDLIDRGRSTPGAPRENFNGENRWPQVVAAIENLRHIGAMD